LSIEQQHGNELGTTQAHDPQVYPTLPRYGTDLIVTKPMVSNVAFDDPLRMKLNPSRISLVLLATWVYNPQRFLGCK
jgi:hypothetical protein